MRCVKHFSVAVVTALLCLTVCVEPEPSCNNAPVALLLPDGRVVMNPGINKNRAAKTSNEQYQNDQSETSGAKHRSKLKKSVGLPLLKERKKIGGFGINSLVNNQQQLTHTDSISFYGSSLLDTDKNWARKSCSGFPLNIVANTNQISSDACRQLRNVQRYNPRKTISVTLGPDDDLNRVNNKKSCTSAGPSREEAEVYNIHTDDKSADTIPGESFDIPKKEFSISRFQARCNDFSAQSYDLERSNQRPSENSQATTNPLTSNQRIYHDEGTPDGDAGVFVSRTARRDLILSANNKNSDPLTKLNRDIKFIGEPDNSPGNPRYFTNYGHNYLINHRRNEAYSVRFVPKHHPLGVFSSDINLEKVVSNDHSARITLGNGATPSMAWKDSKKVGYTEMPPEPSTHRDTVYSNSNSHRKGNMARFQLNLLEERGNLMDDVLLENEKSMKGIQNYSTHREKGRTYSPKKKKTFFIHDRLDYRVSLQNKTSHGCHSTMVPNEPSYSKAFSHLSWGKLKTPAKSKGPRSRPMKTDFELIMGGKRTELPKFAENTKVTDQRPSRKAVSGPQYSCRRPMGTDFAEDLEPDAYLPQFGANQRFVSHSPVCFCHTNECTDKTNVKASETNNYAQRLRDRLVQPVGTTANNNTSKSTINSHLALKDERSVTFHRNSINKREKCINVEIPRGNFENMRRVFEAGTGENCDNFIDRINYNSLEEPLWESNRPAIERIYASNLPKNENRIRFIHRHKPENMQSTNIQSLIIQHPKQPEVSATASNLPAIVPYQLETSNGAPNELFRRPSMLLNEYPELRYLGSPMVSALTTRLSPTISSGPLIHSTKLPWMGLPIHHPPMTIGHRRCNHFLSSFPLPPQTSSIASFVKDESDHWWLIHYVTIL